MRDLMIFCLFDHPRCKTILTQIFDFLLSFQKRLKHLFDYFIISKRDLNNFLNEIYNDMIFIC
jgi:hypothetical protein